MKTFDSHIERAQAAIDEFKKLSPMLTSFARAFTGNHLLKVVPQIGVTATDGKFIYIEPPLALADQEPHNKEYCGRYDGAMRAICPACKVREEVLVNTFHEIAHNWAGTFENVPELDKVRALTEGAKAVGIEVPQSVLDEVRHAAQTGSDIGYGSIAKVISPYLDVLHNALEDARVNTRMGEARPGFDRMRQGDEYDTLYNGMKSIDPNTGREVVTKFGDRSPDLQAALGLYRMASGYEVPSTTHPKVAEVLADERFAEICATVSQSKNVRGPYDAAVRALHVLREYGFMGGKVEDEIEEEPPETPAMPSEKEAEGGHPEPSEGEQDDDKRPESDRGDAGEGSTGDEAQEDRDESGPESESIRSDPDRGLQDSEGEADPDDDDQDEGDSQEGGESSDEPSDGESSEAGAPGTGEEGDGESPESHDAEDSQESDDTDTGSEAGGDQAADGDSREDLSEPRDEGAGSESEEGSESGESSDDSGREASDPNSGNAPSDDAAKEQSDPSEGSDAEAGDEGDADSTDEDSGSGDSEQEGGSEASPSEGDGLGSADEERGGQEGASDEGGSEGEGEPGEGGTQEDAADSDPGVGTGSDVAGPGGRPGGDSSSRSSAPQATESGDSARADDELAGGGESEGEGVGDPLGDNGEQGDASDSGESGRDEQLDTGVDYAAAAKHAENQAQGGTTSNEVDSDTESDEDDSEPLSGGDLSDDPLDTGEFDSDWVHTAHDPGTTDDAAPVEFLTPDEVAKEVEEFFGHDHAPVNEGEEDEAVQALVHVMNSGIFFDEIPRNVAGVRWHKFDEHVTDLWTDRYGNQSMRDFAGAWTHEYFKHHHGSRRSFGIDGDFKVPERVIGAALQRARIAFANNQRTKEIRNLKAGKVNGRVLGRRAPVKDPRLFAKRQRPGRRNYFVVLGGDASLSTTGTAIVLIKRAIMAQAEILNRLGIPFEVIFHSANTARNGLDGYEVDMYLVKQASEPWNDKARARLEEIGPDCNNLDGHTIQLYRKRLDVRTETDRILMYYTDGRMPALNAAEEVEVLKRELRIFKEKDYKLMCVGVRTSSPEDWGLPTVRVDEDSDLVNVVRHLEKVLVQ